MFRTASRSDPVQMPESSRQRVSSEYRAGERCRRRAVKKTAVCPPPSSPRPPHRAGHNSGSPSCCRNSARVAFRAAFGPIGHLIAQIVGNPAKGVDVAKILPEMFGKQDRNDRKIFVMRMRSVRACTFPPEVGFIFHDSGMPGSYRIAAAAGVTPLPPDVRNPTQAQPPGCY